MDKRTSSTEDTSKDEHLDKRVEYLTKRLDHTINHLQTASKLIYIVDGAVLAFAYFMLNTFGFTKRIGFFLGVLSIILAGLNFLHSRFILTQSHWYRENDKRIRSLLKEPDVDRLPVRKFTKSLFTSSHGNLKHIHVWITCWLVVLSVILFLYASGFLGGLAADWATFPLYSGAKDVQNIPLSEGTTKANELYFKVDEAYPSIHVLDYYSKQISGPWISCTSDSDGWQSFGDLSGNSPRYIHQIRRYWVDFNKKRLLLLAIRYYSRGSDRRENPDNNLQNVYLTEYEDDNLQQTAEMLKIKCEPKQSQDPNKSLKRGGQKKPAP
jgi:hypothetical protein